MTEVPQLKRFGAHQPIEVAHFFSEFHSLGGVQAMLQQHHARDREWGMNSRFIISGETSSKPLERVHFMPFSRWTTLHALTKELSFLSQVPQPLVNIYHTIIPMRAYICEHDCAARRVLVLHGKGGQLEEQLEPRRTWLDGVISVSEEGSRIAQRVLPHLSQDRFIVVPVPVSAALGPMERSPIPGRPVVIGYSGRLLKEHKRVDRLPQLCGHLERLGVDYRLELLGDGPERVWLESQFRGNPRVQFLGRKSGEEYLRQFSAWDFIVFVSDTEGQPLSLLEAMSGGVIPIFPRIGSEGDAYTKGVDGRLLYDAGDTEQAARLIHAVSQESVDQVHHLRLRSRAVVEQNLDGTYFGKVADFGRHLLTLPRVSKDQFPWHPALFDRIPMLLATRIALLRRQWLLALSRSR